MESQINNSDSQLKFERVVINREEYYKMGAVQRELKLNGKMYDVFNVQENGDRVVLYLVEDVKEQNMESLMDEADDEDGSMNLFSMGIDKVIFSKYLPGGILSIDSLPAYHEKKLVFNWFLKFSCYLQINTPPPKIS